MNSEDRYEIDAIPIDDDLAGIPKHHGYGPAYVGLDLPVAPVGPVGVAYDHAGLQ